MNLPTSSKLFLLLDLLIFVLLPLRLGSGTQIRCLEKERQALLSFKVGLKNESDDIPSSWLTDDCCEWQGVRCSNLTSHVIAIDLSHSRDLFSSGKIGPSLLELQHLTYLDLSYIKFHGSTIPEFIGSLNKIKYLNLTNTELIGVIPDQLGNLSNLQTLDLSHNQNLSVRNLEWLSHLSSLRHLDLSLINLSKAHDWFKTITKLPFLIELKLATCELPQITTTSFPSFNSSMSLSILDLSDNNHIGSELSMFQGLFNCSGITGIDLSHTGLFGTISEDFGKMKTLEYLYLAGNELEGGIPNSIGNLSGFRSLDLSFNRLNGTIPPSFGKLPKLEFLQLSSNQFEGVLPEFMQSSPLKDLFLDHNKLNGTIPKSIGSLSELERLTLSSNRFEGFVSSVHLMNLRKLVSLDLSDNSLVLRLSSDWTPPFNLHWIYLANCKMGPHFPSWLRSQNQLARIDISGSGIDDAIPNWFWDLSPSLMELNLSNNYIHGILPDLSLKFRWCYSFDLSSNNIEGPIPKLPSNIVFLFLSKNKFQDSIIPLCNNSGILSHIDLSNNLLSGKLPDCLMQFNQLFFLKLANNNFSGLIPSSIGLLNQIQSLHLRNNSFAGELPTSLQHCKKLSVIDIGQNKFTGKIPVWLGRSLSSLVILSLRSNQFKGTIPSEICYLKMIQILDLSVNNISGMIPKCLRNFTTMAQKGSSKLKIELLYSVNGNSFAMVGSNSYAETISLVWKGIESEYGNTLGLVKSIDLSSNILTGEIPTEIIYLEGLVALNISRNNLHGKIPLEIGHLQLLQFLDLSRNQLSGMIPTSLSQLNYIGVLDLSNNNLSGKIPLSTQLQSFNASAYLGNPSLCGLPLSNLCPEDQGNFVPRSSSDFEIQVDEKFINPSFYAALGIGFAVGLWGTLGTLLLNNSLRVAYFRLVANIQNSLYVTIVVNTAKVKRLLKK